MTRSKGLIVACASAIMALAAAADGPPRVDLFSPTGSIQAAEQVRIRFTEPMIELGDPRAPAPASGQCGAGVGRWVDTREWAFDFAAPLPGGLRCNFTLRPGLKSLAGVAVSGPATFAFDTGGPTIVESTPAADSERIEEDQVFALALNAPATPVSIAAGARCIVEGVGEEVPFDPLPATEGARLIAGAGGDDPLRSLLEAAGLRKPAYDDGAGAPKRRLPVLFGRCRRALPPGGRVSLLWGAGIVSPSGITAGVDKRIDVKVRPAFTARFSCSRVNAAAACSPIEAMTVNFMGQVPAEIAVRIRLVGADGKTRLPDAFAKHPRFVDAVSFSAPFAERTAYRVELPAGLADDAGRALVNAARFPLGVRTDEAPPLVKFAGTFGIVEANEGGVLPVTVRNVEARVGGQVQAVVGRALRVSGSDGAVADWLRQLDKAEERTTVREPIAGLAADADDDDAVTDRHGRHVKTRAVETTRMDPLIGVGMATTGLSLPKPNGARAFEVVGIPLEKPGFYVVELASPRLGAALLGRGRTRYVATGALVTDLSVHFGWGRGRSIAWVTRLHDAQPVGGAAVAVTDSCDGTVIATARTDAQGRAMFGDKLPDPGSGDCSYGEPPLMVSARAGDDFSFTLTNWNKGIRPSDFHMPEGYGFDRAPVHTVFDRTLIRAGETIHMKHLLRAVSDEGIAFPADGVGKGTLTIRHLGSDTAYTQPVTIGQDGVGLSDWASPKEAALGEYAVELTGPGVSSKQTGRFQIEAFRLPTMRATVTGPRKPQVRPKTVPLGLNLSYFSGGAAGGAPVTLRTRVEPREISLPDYPDFAWTAEAIETGVVAQSGGGEESDSDGESASAGRAHSAIRASVLPLGLDANGAASADVPVGLIDAPSQLRAEMDYDDANGERRTASARVGLDPAAVRVGLRTDGWIMKSDDVRLKLVTLDLNDHPVRGQRVQVQLYSRETYSYRKRLIGGFYAYDNSTETKKLDADCSATTDDRGYAECHLKPGVSGQVIALATAQDRDGNTARASTTLYVAGDSDWWFGGDNGDRMDLLPEKPEYAIGETARFQVRMPFRNATALVTVARERAMDSFVTELSGRHPVIEVPMAHGYSPNVYVQVMAVRGRIAGWRLWLAELARKWDLPWLSREAASPTALVDLAKPSYRLGMARVRVGWDEHRLGVRVTADAERYKVRQTANVLVQVAAPGSKTPPRGAEIAVAAVDEALLDLKANDSWDVLSAMMEERPLMVEWSTAQTQVVGKRHYGLKAVAAGGGGGGGAGGAPPRADFKPLLLWRGRVPLDATGRARVQVPLNDSISSFRVVAVATAGQDLFGTGAASVRTTQDLILLSGLPPLVRVGDSYDAEVTARNASDHDLRATVSASAGGTLPPITVDLAPGQARRLAWRVNAPAAEGSVKWRFAATAAGASDKLDIVQTVLTAVPVQTLQATLVQVHETASVPVAPPVDALPGKGGIVVTMDSKLAGSMAGAKAYMSEYRYDCFEQMVSKAVVLGDRALWDSQMAVLPRYLDDDGLVRFFPADWIRGDDSLTAYVLTVSAETGWTIPDKPRARMVAALKAIVGGGGHSHEDVLVGVKGLGIVGRANFAGDLAIRRVGAIAALARADEADAAMLSTVAADPGAWPTSTVADWLGATAKLGAAEQASRAEAVLRARLDSQGTALSLTRADAMWWLLGSPDSSAARVLLATADRPDWAGDAGRVARGLVVRTRKGAWDTTVGNALATLALARFSRRFEREAVTGATVLTLGPTTRTMAWGGAPAAQPLPIAFSDDPAAPMPASSPPPTRAPGAPAPVLLPWAGHAVLTLHQAGTGAPWATILARAAVPLKQPFASGYAVRRIVTPVSQAHAGVWHRGDVMRVRIEVDSRADANWTVIDDPVPAGATILGGGLGGRSTILDEDGAKATTGPSPAFVERKQEAARAWFDYAPRGRLAYEYTVRLGAPGRFALPPTRVEAMYVPGMIALVPNAAIAVLP